MEEKFDFYRYLNLFLKHRNYIIIPFIIASAAVTITSYFVPKTYMANTLVLVEGESIRNPIGRGVVDPDEAARKIGVLKQIITSRQFVDEALKKTGIDLDYRTEDEYNKLIENITKEIEVTVGGRRSSGNVFEINFEHKDPKFAAFFVNTITSVYTDYVLSSKKGEAYAGLEFIKEQLEAYKKKLQESEKALSEFKAANLGQLPDSKESNFGKLQTLRDTLPQLDLQIRDAQLRRTILLNSIGSTDGGTVNPIQMEISQKKAALRTLLSKYTEKHPEVIILKQEIGELEKNAANGEVLIPVIDNPRQNAYNPRAEIERVNLEIASLGNRRREIERDIKALEEKVEVAPALEQKYKNLTRDYNVDAGIYQTLLQRLEETKISKEVEKWNEGVEIFKVIDPAIVPVKPVSPNRPKLILVGTVLGFALGFGFAFVREYMSSSLLKSVKEAKEYFQGLGLNVFGTIPVIVTPSEKRKETFKNFSTIAIGIFYVIILGGVFLLELIGRSSL